MMPKSEWQTPECVLLIMLVSLKTVMWAAIGAHLQVDEDLTGSRLGHVEINDLSRDLAGLVVDACLVCAW